VASDPEERGQRSVQSVEVGGRLLLALAAGRGAMNLKDLAAQAGLPPSRAHPYLVSFGKLGLIEQDRVSGRYALGPAALRIGLACLQQLDPLAAAAPVAQELAERTGHAVALSVWGNFGPTVVRLIEARQPLHVSMRAGTVMSILGTATGQAFAAVLPRERIEQALSAAMAEPGETGAAAPRRHKLDGAALAQAVADVRQHGVARAVGRPIPGVNAFSAPAFDHEGRAAIVITALGHQDHFESAWQSATAGAVRAAAAEISRRLGGPSTLSAVPV
jgi:DNA-binding IclR family transcriptional regulator